MPPKVSLFWINYNSMYILRIVKESLDVLMHLDYPNYELIVVDNGSVDGSERFLEKYASQAGIKFVKLKRNLGFNGGVNIAYRARDPETNYVGVVNNDAVPKPYYLEKLVKFLEKYGDVGAVQGVVLRKCKNIVIDSAGMFLDEALNIYAPFSAGSLNTFRNPIYVSCVEGTMPLYRVEAIKRALKGADVMYVSEGFAYYLEDVFLSLMLWNCGYKCVVIPVITGKHYRSATIGKFQRSINLPYYSYRNRLALLYMTNSKETKKVILGYLARLALTPEGLAKRKKIIKALIEGIKLGKELRKRYGIIDLQKVPLVNNSLKKQFSIIYSLAKPLLK